MSGGEGGSERVIWICSVFSFCHSLFLSFEKSKVGDFWCYPTDSPTGCPLSGGRYRMNIMLYVDRSVCQSICVNLRMVERLFGGDLRLSASLLACLLTQSA
eukprot:Selendium_serpulae@DN5125_c0_g2_i2.p1